MVDAASFTAKHEAMNVPDNLDKIKFYPIVNGTFIEREPEEIDVVMWWWKDHYDYPLIDCEMSDDFPGLDKFFAWCPCPNPSFEFLQKYEKP